MKIITVILARGGSKRIPKKNIIDINGKPLIWYSINASLNSNVNETWVSTEDREIKQISLKYGAQVIDRPIELSDDIIMPDKPLVHAAEQIDSDIVVFIQPTSPLIKPKYIDKGIEMMLTGKYDSVFTAYKKAWDATWNKDIEPHGWDMYNRPRSQDAEELWIEDGMCYITKKDCLLTSGLRYSGKMGVIEIDFKDSFEIDTFEDVELIKKLLK
tara:strand:- start:612 stop:1253 length:642 start_codon:yes stop_codon:yes gene_type:complete